MVSNSFSICHVILALVVLLSVNHTSCSESESLNEPLPRQTKNVTGIFNFSLQILRRIKNLILKFRAPVMKKYRNDFGSSKARSSAKPDIFSRRTTKPVQSDYLDENKVMTETNMTFSSLATCPALTYRTVMMKDSMSASNMSSADDSSSSSPQKPLCDPLPLNDSSRGLVQLLNHTQLIETKVRWKDSERTKYDSSSRKSPNSRVAGDVNLANNNQSKITYCVMMMVYAHFCPFSKRVAPIYVALARAYPQIAFYAIHIHDYKRVKSAMSTFGVPKILLLRNGRTVSVFNRSVKSFEVLKSYIHNLTGFEALENVTAPNVTKSNDSDTTVDYGPFTFDTEEFDVYLLFSWVFLLCLLANYFLCSSQGERLRRRIVQLWQEHEHVN